MPKINLISIQGNNTMSKYILKAWTLNKIKENPKLFGGDNGNPAIIKEYLIELYRDKRVENLEQEDISQSVAVSRIKNKILEIYPEYDYRERNKPKCKRHSSDSKDVK